MSLLNWSINFFLHIQAHTHTYIGDPIEIQRLKSHLNLEICKSFEKMWNKKPYELKLQKQFSCSTKASVLSNFLKGVMWCDSKFSFLLGSVTGWLCIDKIPEVAKTKVSKPKRYSLSKLRLCHAPLKWLIQTRPHMSTSRCGENCKTLAKCLRKERWVRFLFSL